MVVDVQPGYLVLFFAKHEKYLENTCWKRYTVRISPVDENSVSILTVSMSSTIFRSSVHHDILPACKYNTQR